MTEWEKILAEQQHEAPFTIQMATNSTTEVWADIRTKLDQNHGWHVRGLRYTFENIDPEVPAQMEAGAWNSLTLQVQRGIDSEILLNAFDANCLMHHSIETLLAGAAGLAFAQPRPLHIPINKVTRVQVLRVLFRTAADQASISQTTVQLTGVLLYDLITAPDDGRTKLGIPIDEI